MHAAYLALNRKKTDEYTAAIEFLDNVLERELKRVLLPLLDEEARIAQTGRDLFGVEAKDQSGRCGELMRSGDAWLVACAAAAAAELGCTTCDRKSSRWHGMPARMLAQLRARRWHSLSAA